MKAVPWLSQQPSLREYIDPSTEEGQEWDQTLRVLEAIHCREGALLPSEDSEKNQARSFVSFMS